MSTQSYRTYRVLPKERAPTLRWLIAGLKAAGCKVIAEPQPDIAPFRVVVETPSGERLGIIAYLFTITTTPTKNRPVDECRFQIKYGSKAKTPELHELWQDPTELFTTIFVGIEPKSGCWVAADPVLHNPTRFFISWEFKQHHLQAIRDTGWLVWERESSIRNSEPVEIVVGGSADRILDLVRFERAARGLDQGHRHLLATTRFAEAIKRPTEIVTLAQKTPGLGEPQLHELAREFKMSPDAILDLIAEAPRLKMAVRGWVAEDHLQRTLEKVPGVSNCQRLNLEGRPDIALSFQGRGLLIECKNVLRVPSAEGLARIDFQRTRASKSDPCSRYYKPTEFDVLAACLHARTNVWEFKYRLPTSMEPHKKCPDRLASNVKVDGQWGDAEQVLSAAVGAS